MEKTIFLFSRKKSRTKPDFAEHYINHHSVLGRTLVRCPHGYAVSIKEAEGWPDAITEHWSTSAMDLLTPHTAYSTKEDFETLLADVRRVRAQCH